MRLAALAFFGLALAAAPLAAQDGAPRGQGGPGGRMMNPLAFDGPPETVAFAKIVDLTTAQQPKYEALRKSYLASTQAQRDSAKALRESMRAAMQGGGDRAAAQPSMERMRDLGTRLGERYQEFESELGFLLTKEQQGRFDAWKEAERTRRMEERRQRMGR